MDYIGCFLLLLLASLGRGSVLERHGKANVGDAEVLIGPKAVDIPEESVTYEGAQVWRVTGADEKSEYLSYLQDKGDLSLWRGNDTSLDVLVLPDVIPRVARFLHQRHIDYDIVIPDLQQAINQENPLKTPEEIEQLEGRNESQKIERLTH